MQVFLWEAVCNIYCSWKNCYCKVFKETSSVTCRVEGKADELWLSFSLTVLCDDNCVRIKRCHLSKKTNHTVQKCWWKRSPTRLLRNDNRITQLNEDKEKLSPCFNFVVVLFVRVIGNIHNFMERRWQPSLSPSPFTSSQDIRQLPNVRSDNSEIVYLFFFPYALL